MKASQAANRRSNERRADEKKKRDQAKLKAQYLEVKKNALNLKLHSEEAKKAAVKPVVVKAPAAPLTPQA
jgi:hypothetical protein